MGAFIVGRSFSGEDLTIDLPSGTDVCDISTFTIWCEEASVFFSRLEVPRSTFVSAVFHAKSYMHAQAKTRLFFTFLGVSNPAIKVQWLYS